MTTIEAIRWRNDALELLDQRRLPHEETWLRCTTADQTAQAIRDLVVRGAPAIGVTAAYGMVLACQANPTQEALERAADILRDARPTAVNLGWAVDRVVGEVLCQAESNRDHAALVAAKAIHDEDREACATLGRHGADLFGDGQQVAVLTHCNAGALATGGVGTALGVVRELHDRGQLAMLWSCEARPILQGARLTSWEAVRDGLPVTLISDSAAGFVFDRRRPSAVVLGADRIAADGSTANKIGTFTLAVLAARHQVPFYVAAPTSTVDLDAASGDAIPIEERGPDEVRRVFDTPISPPQVPVFNPAFDITPPELITAIITERGVARPPFGPALERLCRPETNR